jgi:hypothetical protein
MCDALDRGGDLKFCDPAKCRLYSPEPKTRTIEIPCDVGTTVWFIRNKEIIQTIVEKIVLKSSGLYLKLACNAMYETSCRSIGKTIFFTKEAAEKALE